MASAGAVPVWLEEDDLGCCICHELLRDPTTLLCGHSFCRACLERAWRAGAPRACPVCREPAPRAPLRRNLLLQLLADKLSAAAGLGPASARRPASPPPVTAQKSVTEVVQELTALVEKLVDITKNVQRQGPLLGSRPDKETSSSGQEVSLASPTRVTARTSEEELREILCALEEIQEKLRGQLSWKEAPKEQTQELPEAVSSPSCPQPGSSWPAPKRASQFAQWAITPTFDLGSLSCSLEVSKDCRTVTVSHCQQNYPWSPQRFSASQVFCSQAFSSGRQYWEVDTQYCNDWAVGVASGAMARNRMLGRTVDSWCVEWKGIGRLSVWTMARETVLGSDRPGVVGVWLDLEEGKLAFYSVASQESLMYECEVSACSPLHPAFWLFGLRRGNSLIIKQARV
ncbi:PREDICTED: E3 ubiquitin-protein ligase RNF135 isoform X2 [Chinchilla lanigera]|uniref:E3 ubiquitin-protein ligase RNF135 isoform X2 n=1 Tax=Chinchilla lanigera TaxID=34839 RepID=UPI000695D408|nr:PREDICTED: E3 ubiquitin-protein ligase RNF135 isoform X2 [Chinchilla lanigera]